MFVICFLQYTCFVSNISIKPFFRYKESYFKLGNSENSRFKLKMSFDFGIGLYLFIVNKYSIKEIK